MEMRGGGTELRGGANLTEEETLSEETNWRRTGSKSCQSWILTGLNEYVLDTISGVISFREVLI
jgi:hypothetical protein